MVFHVQVNVTSAAHVECLGCLLRSKTDENVEGVKKLVHKIKESLISHAAVMLEISLVSVWNILEDNLNIATEFVHLPAE